MGFIEFKPTLRKEAKAIKETSIRFAIEVIKPKKVLWKEIKGG